MKGILIVDMQRGFISPNNKFLIDKINNLLKKEQYDKIFLTKYINEPNSLFVKDLAYTKMMQETEQEIVVDILPNAFIFEKSGYGISQNDLQIIKQTGLNELDICGIESDACVYAIALQLFDAKISPNFLVNYSYSDFGNENVINQLFQKQFGKVDFKN